MNDRPDPLVSLLADHDAGLPVDPSVLTDPRADAVLDALAATRADLAAVPREPMPPEFAGRWNAALTGAMPTESPGPGQPPARVDRSGPPDPPIRHTRSPGSRSDATGETDPAAVPQRPGPGSRPAAPNRLPPPASTGPHRPGRRRVRAPRPAVVAGLVLAVVLVVAGVVGLRPSPPSITAAQLGGIARASVGVQEAGPLTDPARREACLRAVGPPGLAPDAPLAGGRPVVFEGHPGVLLLLITGRLATFRVVVVTPGCEALLADTLVGP